MLFLTPWLARGKETGKNKRCSEDMKEVIPPVDKELLQEELTKDKFVRDTNYGSNKIYNITYHDSPNVMREIGRLREVTFRYAGGGTGKEIDIDAYDMDDKPYQQLVVWDPEENEILGGYRYFFLRDAPKDNTGKIKLATSRLFSFSDRFINEFLPHTIELGRSFVQPKYQATDASRTGIFALDNLWDGLGALITNFPETKYFFGKVTMYPRYNRNARNLLLYFLDKYFADKENLLKPHSPLKYIINKEEFEQIFSGASYQEDYRILSQKVREYGENIPPLINSYMSLSPTMMVFGTAINENFGDVEETAIMIRIDDIYEIKKARHILTNEPEE